MKPEAAILDMVGKMIMADGRPFRDVAEDWQWAKVHRPLSARTPDGVPVHPLAYIQIGKGGDKTSAGARQILAECAVLPGTSAYILAGDQEQANILLDLAWEYCERTPALKRVATKRQGGIAFDNKSFLQRMSSDAYSAHGLGARGKRFRFFVDEMWNQPDRELFDAFFTSMGKQRDSQGILLTNAGFNRDTIAYEIRELCRTAQLPGAYYFESPPDFKPGWVRPDYYVRMKASLPPPVFARFIENRWVPKTGSFVTEEQLARCIDSTWTPQQGSDGSLTIAALDYGRKRDRTALYLVRHAPDGRIELLNDWVADPRIEGEIPIALVEERLREVAETFRPCTLLLDPWQMAAVIQSLKQSYHVIEFMFSGKSLMELSANLFNLITAGRLRLYPDPDLEREILLIDVKLESYGWKIDHKPGGYSDRVIALGMAALEAVKQGPSYAEARVTSWRSSDVDYATMEYW